MTEEDQKLVALAALHGARFKRSPTGYWYTQEGNPTKRTIGRAAEFYLFLNGLRTESQHREYQLRTEGTPGAKDVDPAFLASVLA